MEANHISEDFAYVCSVEHEEKYVVFPLTAKSEYTLVSGYIRKIEHYIPQVIIQKIFLYQRCYIMKGNELCTVRMDENEQIFTTKGTQIPKFNTFLIISKPLSYGICKFKIKCIKDGGNTMSIGIVTNLNEQMYKNKIYKENWLFDHKSCGESYQLYLSGGSYGNKIYHYNNGQEIFTRTIDAKEPKRLTTGETIELVADFYKHKLTFYRNSIQFAEFIDIAMNTYYAAFAYTCGDCGRFVRMGRTSFKLLTFTQHYYNECDSDCENNVTVIDKEVIDTEVIDNEFTLNENLMDYNFINCKQNRKEIKMRKNKKRFKSKIKKASYWKRKIDKKGNAESVKKIKNRLKSVKYINSLRE